MRRHSLDNFLKRCDVGTPLPISAVAARPRGTFHLIPRSTMALISCHECGHVVSTEAAACPGCGAPPRLAAVPASIDLPLPPLEAVAAPVPTPDPGPRTERRQDPPVAQDEPELAWLGWTLGGLILLIVIALVVAGAVSTPIPPAVSTATPVESRRTRDSISVLALASADTTMTAERLVTLESTLHVNGFTIPHDSAHRRYSRIMLDSAENLIGQGLTFSARGSWAPSAGLRRARTRYVPSG